MSLCAPLLVQWICDHALANRRLLNDRLYPGLEDALEAEAVAQGEHGTTQDFVEGVMAFLQKRTPAFTGR